MGTPRMAVSRAGERVWEADFSGYGEVRAQSGRAEIDLRYPGQIHDAETGLHYNRFRYYDPETRSYTQPDPLGIVAGLRPHSYVSAPAAQADPYGLACTYYRSMSEADYKRLVDTGRMPGTSETFISPTQSFSENHTGVLVEFTMNPKVTGELEAIGVRDASRLTREAYPDMPMVSSGWRENNAFFKGEGSQINIGLGTGKALDTFNDNIMSFRKKG